jgi:hypothetical protein
MDESCIINLYSRKLSYCLSLPCGDASANGTTTFKGTNGLPSANGDATAAFRVRGGKGGMLSLPLLLGEACSQDRDAASVAIGEFRVSAGGNMLVTLTSECTSGEGLNLRSLGCGERARPLSTLTECANPLPHRCRGSAPSSSTGTHFKAASPCASPSVATM